MIPVRRENEDNCVRTSREGRDNPEVAPFHQSEKAESLAGQTLEGEQDHSSVGLRCTKGTLTNGATWK